MNDGNQPAFPVKDSVGNIYAGMTLRDYFAGRALQAMISNPAGYVNLTPSELATRAYDIAYAMIEERKGRG